MSDHATVSGAGGVLTIKTRPQGLVLFYMLKYLYE